MSGNGDRHPPALPRRLLHLGAWFTGLVCLSVVAGNVLTRRSAGRGLPVDRMIRRRVHQFGLLQGEAAHMISEVGAVKTVAVVDLLLVCLLLVRRRFADARFVAVAVTGASGLYLTTKPIVDRSRPALTQRLKPRGKSSFPSGHAVVDMALLTASLHLVRTSRLHHLLQLAGLSWLLAVGAARVAADEHHPSDVAAGWLVSWLWVRAVIRWSPAAPPAEPQHPR